MAAGNLQITDRRKDSTSAVGFNVYPAEIEQVLATAGRFVWTRVIGYDESDRAKVGREFLVPQARLRDDESTGVILHSEYLANFKAPRFGEGAICRRVQRNADVKVVQTATAAMT